MRRDPGTLFLHEGEKAAQFAATLNQHCLNHPWQAELDVNAVHLGWVGGAQAVHRSDWAGLRKVLRKKQIDRIIIVPDNDAQGLEAVAAIARELPWPTFQLRFPENWRNAKGKGFDIADDFPASQFKRNSQGELKYIGPRFHDCLGAATWATDTRLIETGGRGRPAKAIHLRPAFAQQWVFVDKPGLFVNRLIPSIDHSPAAFDRAMRPFTAESGLAALMLPKLALHCDGFAYRPGQGEFIPDRGRRLFNCWRPTDIKRVAGDPQPFLDFLIQLLPVETERYEVQKWMATLIARPENRLVYSVLLYSEMQGVGKDTLGRIVSLLVGKHNTSNPSAQHILESAFHEWLLNKSLIIVSEIYEGHNWRCYNKLKSLITEETKQFNIKNVPGFESDLAAQFLLLSNSPHCLKIENSDRRLLVPVVTEVKWDKAKFKRFYEWLFVDDGLGIVLDWAFGFNDYARRAKKHPTPPASG